MRTMHKIIPLLVIALGMGLGVAGCDKDNHVTGPDQNNFPTVQGITIAPNAPVFVGDRVTLTPVTSDPNSDHIRYTWTKNAGEFDPIEAVGPQITWIAPATMGIYQVTVVGDDGNGGTSQKYLDLNVIGGNQSGKVDMVGGVRVNPTGGLTNVGYVDTGDLITLVWDHASPITIDSTRPDQTKYAPDGSRVDPLSLGVVSDPQFGAADGLPAQNAARYCLLGRIESGSWFAFTGGADADADGIPDSFTAIAPARGKLLLGLNEQESLLADNTGFWRFSFTLTHP